MTHTYVVMEVSGETFEEIRTRLISAGYEDAVHDRYGETVLDLHGIALKSLKEEEDD